MKKTFLLLFFMGLVLNSSFSQNCTTMFFPSERGAKFQHSSYKGDGTLDAIVDVTVLSVSTAGGKKTIQAGLRGHMISSNETYNTTLETVCDGNITYTDPSQLMDPAMLETFFNEYDGRVITKPIEIPYNLKVGDELSPYFLEVFGTIKTEEGNYEVHFSSQTYGRTVIGKEDVETLTGTFNCFIIESTTHTIMEAMGMAHPTTTTSKLWVAKGVGTVKMENYKDGGLENYIELTGFSQ